MALDVPRSLCDGGGCANMKEIIYLDMYMYMSIAYLLDMSRGGKAGTHVVYLVDIYCIRARYTTTTTTTNYPHLLVRATDRTFAWPESQGPGTTVSCMGRGAAGTHASWQMGARAWMGISPAHRITNYRCL